MLSHSATTFSMIFETAFKFEMGLKLLSFSWLSDGFFRSGFKTATFRDDGTSQDSRDKLTILQITGSKVPNWLTSRLEGRGSRQQDLEDNLFAILDNSSVDVGVKISS